MYILIMLILSIIYLGFAIHYYIAMSRIWAEPKKEKKKTRDNKEFDKTMDDIEAGRGLSPLKTGYEDEHCEPGITKHSGRL